MTHKLLENLRKGVDVVNSVTSNSMFLRSRNIGWESKNLPRLNVTCSWWENCRYWFEFPVLLSMPDHLQYAFDHCLVCQKAIYSWEHESKGRKAHNAYPFEIVCDAVTFIKNYASVFGLPQPAALRGRANQAPTYLPAHQNHKITHQKYREAHTKENMPFMQYRSFRDVWHACVPHIIFTTPWTDVCQKCEDFCIVVIFMPIILSVKTKTNLF